MKAQLKQLQTKMLEKWLATPELVDINSQREYNMQLRNILQRQQAKFFPKHGFEATTKGMTLMQGIFNNYIDDQDIQDNVNAINAIVGTDYAWAPPDLQPKLFFTQGQQAAAATPAIEEENVQASE